MLQSPAVADAKRRGYFTPDEDDRVRQRLLAYRNYRIAAYEIVFRCRDFRNISDDDRRARTFLVVYAAALLLYEKSLRVIEVTEHEPMLRAKLNEADAKYDLEEGFFEDVLHGYSSLSNYRAISRGDRFWRRHRNSALYRKLAKDDEWGWLATEITERRRVVRRRIVRVLWRRLCCNGRDFWKLTMRPSEEARAGLQSLLGGRFAGLTLAPQPEHVLTESVLRALQPQLQPGDVLLCRAEGKLTSALLPGFWSHAAIYLGTRGELEELGVQHEPHARDRWGLVPDEGAPLGCVIEGVSPSVRLSPLEVSLHADHVVVLRPRVSREELVEALGGLFGHLDKPYDFEFNFNTTNCVVCTELVYRCYHGRGSIELPLVKRLGRFTLTGDDVVRACLDSGGDAEPALRPVALILKRRDGRADVLRQDRIPTVLRRIQNGWFPARKRRTKPPSA